MGEEVKSAPFEEKCSECGKVAQGYFVLMNLRTGQRICLLCAEEEANRAPRVARLLETLSNEQK